MPSLFLMVFHAVFTACAIPVLWWLKPPLLGWGLVGLAVGYNVLLPWYAWLRHHGDVARLWSFLFPLSMLLLLPDAVLSQMFGILVFPHLGAPHIGSVPVYMAGFWVIPLVLIVWIAQMGDRVSASLGWLIAALASLVILGGADWVARRYALWYAHGVSVYAGVARYALVSDMLLGLATVFAWRVAGHGRGLSRLVAASAVTTFYTGALVLSYFLIARVF